MKAITVLLLTVGCLLTVMPAPRVEAADKGPVLSGKDEPMETMLDFYRKQSVWTDPGAYASMYKGIPDGVGPIVKAVQNVLVHGGLLWLYKIAPTEQQRGGMNIRRVEEMLGKIGEMKAGNLLDERAADQRLVVVCRQFAVLTCSILRFKGIPARVRAGYALYTWGRGKYENHWICEYWHPTARRWAQVDAQIDAAQRKLMRIEFDTCNMPVGHFVSAGKGWQQYRQGKVDGDRFGLGGKDGFLVPKFHLGT